jgi:hypothetical protein
MHRCTFFPRAEIISDWSDSLREESFVSYAGKDFFVFRCRWVLPCAEGIWREKELSSEKVNASLFPLAGFFAGSFLCLILREKADNIIFGAFLKQGSLFHLSGKLYFWRLFETRIIVSFERETLFLAPF